MSFGYQVLGFGAFPNREGVYQVRHALVFDGVKDYLTKTFLSAGTSRTVYTFSFWAKQTTVSPTGGNNYVLAVGASSGSSENIRYTGNGLGSLYIEATNGEEALHTGDAARFRDLTAWQHVVWARNTGNSNGDKNKLLSTERVLRHLIVLMVRGHRI